MADQDQSRGWRGGERAAPFDGSFPRGLEPMATPGTLWRHETAHNSRDFREAVPGTPAAKEHTMKSLVVLSASVLLTLSALHGTAHACSPAYNPDGLSNVAVVGTDTLPLDSGLVMTANLRKVSDADALRTLTVEVTNREGASIVGKTSIVKRQPSYNGAERVVIQWLPDTPLTEGQEVRARVTQPVPDGKSRATEHTFLVSGVKLAELVAPQVLVAGTSFQEAPDTSVPAGNCKVAESQPGMCTAGLIKGADLSFAPRLRQYPFFLVEVKRSLPPALDAFVEYTVAGGTPIFSVDRDGRLNVPVGVAPAGSEFCVEISAVGLTGGTPRTAKSCAQVPESPPVSEANQAAYLSSATKLCEAGTITPDDVAEDVADAQGGSSGGHGCNATNRNAPAPVAGIAAVAALVALRRRSRKAKSEGTTP